MKKKIINNIIIYIIIIINIFLIKTSNADQDLLPKIIGSNKDFSKEVIVLWSYPENEWYDKYKPVIDKLIEYYKSIGYTLTFHNLGEIAVNGKIGNVEKYIEHLKSINNSAIFVQFTHGAEPIEEPEHNPCRANPGFAVEFFKDEIDRNNRFKELMYSLNDGIVFTGDPVKDQEQYNHYYVCGGELPSTSYKHTEYIYTINLQARSLQEISELANTRITNNGIVFLMACSSSTFQDNFIMKGAKVVYSFPDKVDPRTGQFVFSGVSQIMLGVIDGGERSRYKLKINNNTHEAKFTSHARDVLSIYPLEENYQNSLILYRAPHIDEITVFSGQKNTDSYQEYYRYVYEGKDIHNPTQPYPWKDYKSTDKPPSQQELTACGSIKPLGAGIEKLNIELLFSEKMQQAIDVKLGFSSASNDNDVTIKGKIEDPKSDKSKWAGTLEITNVIRKKLFKEKAINFHIKGEDTIAHDDMKGLDKDGDGRWFTNKDGEFDNNHWFMVGSEPVMTVSSMEIDELHLPFQQAPPDGRVNMQPVMLNGDIALPENFSWQEVYCDDKTGVEHDRCIYNIKQNNYNDNLEPTKFITCPKYISAT